MLGIGVACAPLRFQFRSAPFVRARRRADASAIHGNGSRVQEAALRNSTKRSSKRRRKID